jgi:hypothetical protein
MSELNGSGKVRIVIVEAEGNAAALAHAIQVFASRTAEPSAVASAPVAPVSLPAPPATPRAKAAAPAKAAEPGEPAPKGTLTNLILEALGHGPCSTGEVKRYVAAARVATNSVDQTLFSLRKQNRIYKDDTTLAWNLATN